MTFYIDNYSDPNTPVVDITGKPLNIVLNFADKGPEPQKPPTDHPLAAFLSLLSVPPSLLNLLNTPLSQMGDEFWAQNVGPNGKTIRDSTAARITSEISTRVPAVTGGLSDWHLSGLQAIPPEISKRALLGSGHHRQSHGGIGPGAGGPTLNASATLFVQQIPR